MWLVGRGSGAMVYAFLDIVLLFRKMRLICAVCNLQV